MLFKLKPMKQKNRGFTLIEMIIGIVVFSLSLSIILSLIGPAEENSADQIHQIKASELAQSLIDDIMSRSFDENSDRAGGLIRCDDNQNGTADIACTSVMGPDAGEDTRSDFDDVDDFHNYSEKIDSTDDPLDGGYASFEILVTVQYDGVKVRLAQRLAKRISVTVTTPLGTAIEFTVYKANF